MNTTNSKPKLQPEQNNKQKDYLNSSQLAKDWIEVVRLSGNLFQKFAKNQAKKGLDLPSDELGMMSTFQKFSKSLLSNPDVLLADQIKIWWDYYELWNQTFFGMMGFNTKSKLPGIVENDRRFKSPSWQESFVFNFIKQSYQILAYRFMRIIGNSRGLSEEEQKKLLFYSRLFVNSISPSNFVLTNPDILRATINSSGNNLVKGLQNLLKDLNNSNGLLRIKMTDEKAFELGKNIAKSPGKIVYQNRIMQVIQYSPTTSKVYQEPILIISPWINKYYILDLQEKNSFIKYCVDSGFTVFVTSWVNPDQKLSNLTLDNYLKEGTFTAIDVVTEITQSKQIHTIGYCIGGTLQAAMLSIMATNKDTRVKTATFFTSLIDFSIVGDLGVFIDEAQLDKLEYKMSKKGYLEGTNMATIFNMLRDNELIWSFVINNYLLGKDPMPFDLLYWNSDSTRMPAKMHSFYLRNMYLENKFKDPGGISLLKTPIDVSKIKTPVYFVSTIEDHIAPWQGTYLGAKLLSGETNFILGGSGHIAGIINPPISGKYFYLKNKSQKLTDSPEKWLESADRYEGSWWNEWQQWLANKSSKDKVDARKGGSKKYKVIEDAPGSYVKMRIRPQR